MPSRDSAAGGIPRPDSREGGDRRAETRWLPRVRRTARGKRSIVARVVARQPGPGTRTGSRRASDGHARSRRPSAAPSGATLRALRAARHSTALPAMQHRKDPVRRLLAAFILAGRPDGRRERDCPCRPFPISCGTGIGCSGHCSVPGVMDRLKGRRGPTIFLAEEPKKS